MQSKKFLADMPANILLGTGQKAGNGGLLDPDPAANFGLRKALCDQVTKMGFPMHEPMISVCRYSGNGHTDRVSYQNSDMDTFGTRLKRARLDAKLTQKAVAQRIGMSQSTLSELENDAYPTSVWVTKLAHLYGVNPRWLGEGVGPRQPSPTQSDEVEADPRILDLWNRYLRADEDARDLVDLILCRPAEIPVWAAPIADAIEGMVKTVGRMKPRKSAPAKKSA